MSTVASKLCSFYNLRNRHILRPKFFGWIATCHYSADGKNTQYVLSDDNERKLVRVILDERKARVKERHRILQGIVQEKKEGFKESSQLLHGVLQDGKERIKESGQLLQGALQDGKERIKESGQLLQGALQDGKERIKERGQLLQGTLQDRKERIKERGQILQGALQERKERLKESSQMLQGVLQQKKERFKESSQVLLEDIKETRNKMKEKVEEVIERENVLTIPNLLCVSRIIMSPVLGYLVIQADFHLALGVFVLAGISDLLDGWIARTFKNQASKMGSFLDPMADKVLIATLFLSLTYMDLIPVVLTGGIITRDLVLVAAGFYVRYKSLPPPRTLSRYFDVTHATAQLTPTFISKCNTGVQLLLVASTLAAPVFSYVDHPALHAMWYITAGTTVASAISYLISKNTYKFLRPQKK